MNTLFDRNTDAKNTVGIKVGIDGAFEWNLLAALEGTCQGLWYKLWEWITLYVAWKNYWKYYNCMEWENVIIVCKVNIIKKHFVVK